jgi:hypothetical protein
MAKASPAPKSIANEKGVATCHQVLADGRICQSPALRKQLFCYYHSRQRDRQRNIAVSARRRKSQSLPDLDIAVITSLNLPTPDDPIAIQVCIAGILQSMMTGALSGALGGRLLYGLHLAKCNYREVDSYNERHRNPAFVADHADSVPVAATDPEPIPALDETAKDDSELDRYAALLEIDELQIPDPTSIAREVEAKHDAMLHDLVRNLNISQADKDFYARTLTSDSSLTRSVARQRILDRVYRHLAETREDPSQKKPPQPAPNEEVTA